MAVLGVIIWHADLAVQGRLLLPGGFLGVDIFFVISGFLMARIWAGNITIKDFVKRRLRRILPMLFVTILICIPFAAWVMGPSSQAGFGADAIASVGLVPNIFYSFQDSYWSAPSKLRPLLHLWTIGVEMQFYLICPFIFLAIKKYSKPVLGLGLMTALSFAAAIWLSRSHPEFAFYNLPTRLWEFGLGAMVFYLPASVSPSRPGKSIVMTILGLVLIVGSLLYLSEAMIHPGALTLLPVTGSCLVIAGGRNSHSSILTFKLLRRIGLISFSAYLIHQPLFAFSRMATDQLQLSFAICAALIVLTLILSELTYRLIETPLRKAGKGRALIITLLGMAAFTGALITYSGSLSKTDTEALLIKPDRWILNAVETRCVNQEITHPCRLGNSEQEPSIALLGDSHMQAMAGGLDEFFKAQNLNDIDYSMGGCPFIMDVRRYTRKYPCDEYVENVFEALSTRNIKTVIILDRRNAYLLGTGATYNDGRTEPADVRLYPVALGQNAEADAIKAELKRLHLATIQRLRDMNIRIVLVLPVPEIGIHVPDNLPESIAEGTLPLTLDRKLHAVRQAPLAPLKSMAVKDTEILVIDPADIFCDAQACKTHSDSEVYYTDRDHLSRAGTELFLSEAGSEILDFVTAFKDDN